MYNYRELDVQVSVSVLGHSVSYEENGSIFEITKSGVSRVLPVYTLDIQAAWEVVERLAMTVIPVDAGWFAFVGNGRPWSSPAEFITYLQKADFINSGAAVGESAPLTICLAALKIAEKGIDVNATLEKVQSLEHATFAH